MDDLHLKLQLTAEDARYVREKFLVAVDDKINYHLPAQLVFDDGAQQQQEDPMRSKVEDLVKDEEIEPFDFELNDRLRQLYGRVDDLTLEIARLRKRIPAESTRLYQHALERRRELEQQAASEPDADAEDTVDADTDARLQQLRDIKHTYYDAIGGLDELISTIPETKTQLEQLEQAVQFIQNEQDPESSKPQ
ncbi:hypothetical protein DV495_001755 [Geotrichum candidum]|nr:hypothetical protein DV452_003032 [Geotrichum candidum]KAF5131941.1 hypothetical protein DV495_001755 [Geotrichum candidum]KAI9212826.1 hypothetical protein DS838_002322 [Geotrichum bryndzae]